MMHTFIFRALLGEKYTSFSAHANPNGTLISHKTASFTIAGWHVNPTSTKALSAEI
jgi:hypothetical protein